MEKKRGRRSKYRKEFCDTVRELASQGLMIYQIAQALGVSNKTIYTWANTYPEFKEAINDCHEIVVNMVEASLFKSAMGYDYEELEEYTNEAGEVWKTVRYRKHSTANDRAAKWILSNKRPNDWREKQTIEHQGNMDIEVIMIGDEEDEETNQDK